MKVKYFLLLLVAITPFKSFSQGGSNYSSIGIGDLFPSTNAAYQAMGSTFISVPAENSINVKNPAMWSVASSTRILLGYNFNQHLNETSDATLFQNNGKISGLFTLFNIDKSLGISASFGLHSYSNINYLVSNKFSIEKDGLTQTGKNTFQGSGGLSSAYLGASANIIDNFSVGASAFAIFGPIKNSVYTEFDDYYSYNYEVIKSDYATSWGSRFGIYYYYDNLHFGAFYEFVDDIKFKRETQFSSSVISDTIIKSSLSEKFPSQYGVGISYKTGKFLFSSDFLMMNFKDFKYNPISNSEFTDAYKLSFGAIRYGNTSRFSEILDRVNYKAGIYYQKLYYKINNQEINELGLSFGGEIPLGSGGILDVALILGNRGRSNDYLINEYFCRLFVEISIGEIWFKPFKRRYE